MEVAVVDIPYKPRKHFRPLHASEKRFNFVCAHRRAGKTVSLANKLIKAGALNPRRWPPPRYAYVGPSFDQAKDLVWEYLKQYTAPIDGMEFLEGELKAVFPHGPSIKLYGGSAAYQRMRGMYFDGIVLDEYPLLEPTVFSAVVRPCLADYRGWAVVSGTSNGDDHFGQLKLRAELDPRWDVHIIPLSTTGEEALTYEEARELTQDMTPEEYAREMECSFDAPVEGSYFGETLNKMSLQNRITVVPPDINVGAVTCWDLGIHDHTCIWTYQSCGRELHWINFIEGTNKDLSYYISELYADAKKRGYSYKAHCLPHDVEARELSTGQSRKFYLSNNMHEPIVTSPACSPEDSISAARGLLGVSYIDGVHCKRGLSWLRAMKRTKNGAMHHPSSHGGMAFCTGATAFHLVGGFAGGMGMGFGQRLRRRIRGLV